MVFYVALALPLIGNKAPSQLSIPSRMNSRVLPLLLAAVLGLLPTLVLQAKSTPKPTATVDVQFDKPEDFTDVKDSAMGSDKGRDSILEEISDYIKERAVGIIPEGSVLKLTFTEVDLAGDFEPARSVRFQDVRIVKDIYPPRFDFTYTLTDASGAVIKQGTEKLRDLSFMMRMTISRNDPLHYEKDMLLDWIRGNLRAPKK